MIRFLALITSSFALAAVEPNSAMGLKDVFQSALQNQEAIQVQSLRVKQSEESVAQARGALFPRIGFLASYQKQDSAAASGAFRSDQFTTRINLTQPLFRGMGDWAFLRAIGFENEAAAKQFERAKLDLYVSVSNSFFNILALEQDVQNLESIKTLTDKRVGDLQKRSKIGRTRSGEVLSAQAQLALLQAQIDNAKALVKIARESFEVLTHLPANTSLKPHAFVSKTTALPNLEEALSQVESRPEIEAIKYSLNAADERTAVARAGHWPTLDFSANYYPTRSGLLETVKWDVGATVTLSLFEGGAVQSQVRQAVQRKTEQELLLAQARKAALAEIRNTYHNVQNSVSQVQTLEEALRITEKNYQEQQRDYGLGLVTNLEALQALNTLQETKRSLDKARFELLSQLVQFEVSTGKLPN